MATGVVQLTRLVESLLDCCGIVEFYHVQIMKAQLIKKKIVGTNKFNTLILNIVYLLFGKCAI